MATFNSGIYYSFNQAYNDIVTQIRGTTLLNSLQTSDCLDALAQIPDEVRESITPNSSSYQYTGKYGYTCIVTYEFDRYERYFFITLDIDQTAAAGTTTSTTTTTTTSTTTSSTTTTSTTTTAAPTLPSPTPPNKYYKWTAGVSLISGINNQQTIGITTLSGQGQYISAEVKTFDGSNMPNYTTFTLYNGSSALLSAASQGGNNKLKFFYQLPSESAAYTAIVQTVDNGLSPWIAVTTLSAYGTARFYNGSSRGYVYPYVYNPTPSTGYAMTLFAGESLPNVYLRTADFLDVNAFLQGKDAYLDPRGPYFDTLLNNITDVNPIYGTLVPTERLELNGYATNGDKVLDAVLEYTIATPLIQTLPPLKLYTPWTFALTGQPVWVQSISASYDRIKIDWGDGYSTPVLSAIYQKDNFFTHSYSTASDTPYTVLVSAFNDSAPSVKNITSLSARFYIQGSFPAIDLDNYTKSLGINIDLPYSKNDIEVGSNEWAVANNINAALEKIDTNYRYLDTVSRSIKKSPNFTIIEWLGDLIAYPTWNTLISGSNTYTSISSSYLGVTPGTIIDFKSYSSGKSAPDYYNYYALSNGSIQIRENNFTNTPVLTLSSVVPGVTNFNARTVEVSGNSLYLLAESIPALGTGSGNTATTLYRFNLNYNTNSISLINQIGGAKGNISDPYTFNNAPAPSDIKAINNKIYVGDIGNGCVKVYNSSLTYTNTISASNLSDYNVSPFDIDRTNENVFILGKIKKPNTPVITSIVSSVSAVDSTIYTQYQVTWNHDGERLAINDPIPPDTYIPNFEIWGKVGDNPYTKIDSIYSNVDALNSPKLTTYIFTTTSTYSSFKIKALGFYSNFDSDLSSSIVVPNKNAFPSPYNVFVFDKNSNLLNTYNISEVPSTASVKKLLIDPTSTFFYVVTESYLYKYTTTGLFVNRISNPSKEVNTLGIAEDIVTAFIDDRCYIHITTPTRVFKFIDLPLTTELYNKSLVSSYYSPLSTYNIGENEYIQDWVYNRAINRIYNNHEVLAKNINAKYVVNVDNNSNLISFFARELSGGDTVDSLSATESSFIHSNEIVSSAVVNRTLDYIYNAQRAILSAIKPEVHVTEPSYTANILGAVTAASGNIIYQYIQPDPVFITQPQAASLITGDTATFTVSVSSASANAYITYQWYYGTTAIPGASSSSYTIDAVSLDNVGYYTCEATDNIATITSNSVYLAVSLETLFSFASAEYVGNLYGPLFNGSARYGDTYIAQTNLINASSAVVVQFDLAETFANWSAPDFSDTVYYTIKFDDTPIASGKTDVKTTIKVPLSSYVTTDSSTVQSDGYPGTYAGKLEIALSVGAVTTNYQHGPKVKIFPTEGYLYNAIFTNSMSAAGATNGDINSGNVTVYGLSGKYVNFASINNNSLGGYLAYNPYIEHHWKIDNNIDGTVPLINYTPSSMDSITLSATRPDNIGETSLTYNLCRTSVNAPVAPYYTLTTGVTQYYYGINSAKSPGNGYAIGSGAYKAGTLVPVYAVATYGWFGRTGGGSITSDAFNFNGAGTLNEAITGPTYSGQAGGGDGGRADLMIYIDGNKSINVGFKH